MNIALQAEEQFENNQQADWDTDKHALAKMVAQWGYNAVLGAVRDLDNNPTFAFGYDDSASHIHQRCYDEI